MFFFLFPMFQMDRGKKEFIRRDVNPYSLANGAKVYLRGYICPSLSVYIQYTYIYKCMCMSLYIIKHTKRDVYKERERTKGDAHLSTGRKQRHKRNKNRRDREEDVATVDLFREKAPPPIGRQCAGLCHILLPPLLLLAAMLLPLLPLHVPSVSIYIYIYEHTEERKDNPLFERWTYQFQWVPAPVQSCVLETDYSHTIFFPLLVIRLAIAHTSPQYEALIMKSLYVYNIPPPVYYCLSVCAFLSIS